MKDAAHHLKHTQKKVLQSVRKSEEKPVVQATLSNTTKNSKKDASLRF